VNGKEITIEDLTIGYQMDPYEIDADTMVTPATLSLAGLVWSTVAQGVKPTLQLLNYRKGKI
jgi:hypothetical protein